MPPGSANRDIEAALAYHDATKHSERSVRSSTHFLDFANQPLPFKVYRDLPPIPLVEVFPKREAEVFPKREAEVFPKREAEDFPKREAEDFPKRDVPALLAISHADPPPSERERVPDLAVLSRVLWLSAGITKRLRHARGELFFRAYPNTGALYHVDLYLVTGELPGLAAGVYHFGPHDFALRRLREGDFRAVLVEASGAHPAVERAPVVMASASTYWRNAWKYQARAWRHCFWDAGTLHANLLAAAAPEDLEPEVVMGYADAKVERLLGLDPGREGSLTLVPLGRSSRPAPPAPRQDELRLATERLSRTEVHYPEIRTAQAASALADGAEAAAWRSELMAPHTPPARGKLHPLEPLADARLPRDPLERVIGRRGSTRAFERGRSLDFAELSTLLDRTTRGVPADFLPPGGTLLDLYLIVHAVEGLAPGAYFFRREERSLELLREGQLRHAAGRLALGQDLAADAAVNVYSLADLAGVLARFGNRGYRAVQLEGGITGGRLYLAAYALGFGATGLTFFDDMVTELFSPHAAGKSVLFLTALGHADRAALGLRPKPRA